MITNDKTTKQLLAERDFLNALITCLRECGSPQAPATLLQGPPRNADHPDGDAFSRAQPGAQSFPKDGASASPARNPGKDH